MLIRPAAAADLDLVISLRLDFIADVRGVERRSLAGPFADATATFVTEAHARGALHSWLAHDGDEAAGLVSLVLHDVPPRPEEPRTREGYVINMFVAPAHRGRGVGMALLETCHAAAADLQLRRLVLHFTDEGLPLYRRAGYVPDPAWLQLPLTATG